MSSSSVSRFFIPASMPPRFITSRLWLREFRNTRTSLSMKARRRSGASRSGGGESS